MKYPYIVKKNGVWFPAGTEVPEETNNKNSEKDFIVDNEAVGQIGDDVIEITDKELVKENRYTKTEINRMSTAELKEVATLNGVENVEDMTGAVLKEVLIEKFGL